MKLSNNRLMSCRKLTALSKLRTTKACKATEVWLSTFSDSITGYPALFFKCILYKFPNTWNHIPLNRCLVITGAMQVVLKLAGRFLEAFQSIPKNDNAYRSFISPLRNVACFINSLQYSQVSGYVKVFKVLDRKSVWALQLHKRLVYT